MGIIKAIFSILISVVILIVIMRFTETTFSDIGNFFETAWDWIKSVFN